MVMLKLCLQKWWMLWALMLFKKPVCSDGQALLLSWLTGEIGFKGHGVEMTVELLGFHS